MIYKEGDFYNQDYIDEQIEEWGAIEEYDDGLYVCPYCGYVMGSVFNDVENGDFDNEEYECGNCGKTFLMNLRIKTSEYYRTRRIEVKK